MKISKRDVCSDSLDWGMSWGWRDAGLVSLWTPWWKRYSTFGGLCFHFFPDRRSWQYGLVKDWYDGPLYTFGFGPLLLVAW